MRNTPDGLLSGAAARIFDFARPIRLLALMSWHVRQSRGVHLPQIGWWLDAQKGQPRSFATHAHSDHIGPHREIVATRATASLMRLRLPGRRQETILDYGETWRSDFDCEFTLHPAGHVFGSAMVEVRGEHGSLLYTGDFKLRPSLASELCATPQADVLIMETTFGLPRYVLPPQEQIVADIVNFCRDALAEKITPVLYAYSLGKTQELVQILGQAGLPLMLHTHNYRVTQHYAELGMKLPPFRPLDPRAYAGHVIIAPPMSGQAEPITWINPKRTAVVTGWALDSSTRYQSGTDAAFPLSDHADFPDLLAFVDRVKPKVVYTLHGFAKEFAATLRQRGVEAWAIGQGNQLELRLA